MNRTHPLTSSVGSSNVSPLGDQRSDSDFRAALIATIDGMVVVDGAGMVRFANPAAETLLGQDSGALLGHPFRLPLATRGQVAELDVLRPDGAQVVVEMHIGAMTWQGEKAELATLLDITSRKKAENELRSSEERYALASRGANDVLWDLDLNTGHLYTSARWDDMLGLATERMSEPPVSSMGHWIGRVHPRDVSSFDAEVERHLRGETDRLKHEHRLRHADGSYIPVLVRGAAVYDHERPVRLAGSITDLTAAHELRYQAFHDGLTGLGNRTLFLEHLKTALSREKRLEGDYQVVVLFVDLDRFKSVNDSLGHDAGDRLLTIVAGRMKDCLRRNDLCARLGGDEFAVLLDGVADSQAVLTATLRIQEEIAHPIQVGDQRVYTTASIGIVLPDGQHLDGEEALRHADIAMYRAKARGPGNFEIFERSMHQKAVEGLRLHSELQGGVERSEFIVRYQPIVDLVDGHVTGFEALLRWRHPERGILDAESFIEAAEQTGAITPLSWRILTSACRQAKAWTALDASIRVSVNVSNHQFMQRDFADQIAVALQDSGIAGSALQLEITERVIIDDYTFSTRQLERCHALGVDTVMDDFGTGQSSLMTLRKLPIDGLKVDRSFIAGLEFNDEGAEVVEAILALGQSLRLEVVAEGIESAGQRARLIDLGCRVGQGHLFERALDSQEATILLEQQPPRTPGALVRG